MSDLFFVSAQFMVPWKQHSLMSTLDKLFDETPPKGYKFSTFTEHAIMAHIMRDAKIFDSVGNAKKNGWDKPIPPGFSMHHNKKRALTICIYNVYDGWQNYTCEFISCRCGQNNMNNMKNDIVCPHEGPHRMLVWSAHVHNRLNEQYRIEWTEDGKSDVEYFDTIEDVREFEGHLVGLKYSIFFKLKPLNQAVVV